MASEAIKMISWYTLVWRQYLACNLREEEILGLILYRGLKLRYNWEKKLVQLVIYS